MMPKTAIAAGLMVMALCAVFVCASVNLYVGAVLGVGMLLVYPRALNMMQEISDKFDVPFWNEGLYKLQTLISLAFLALCFMILPAFPTVALVIGIIMAISFLCGIIGCLVFPALAKKCVF
jgi:hypothetical protein